MTPARRNAIIQVFLANLIWAGAASIIKLTLQDIPPFSFLFIRLLVVCLILLPYALFLIRQENVNKKDYFNIILIGICSQSALAFVFLGLKYTTSIDMTIIGLIAPVLSVALGHYFYKEEIGPNIKVGLLLVTVGSLIILTGPTIHSTTGITIGQKMFGNFLIILNSLALVLYIFATKISLGQTSPNIKRNIKLLKLKPMTKQYTPELLTTVSFYIGLLTTTPLAFIEGLGGFGLESTFSFSEFTPQSIAGLAYMIFLSSIVAYFCFGKGVKDATVTDTAIIGYLGPLMALPFAYLLLREVPTVNDIIAGGLIAAGVLIAEFHKN